MITAKAILEKLVGQGHRKTKVRVALISILVKIKKPLDVPKLHSLLIKIIGKIHKTTIYREIDFLITQNIITEIYFTDGKKRYEIAHLPHHHHLVCTQCEYVEDILINNDLAVIEKAISQQKSFVIMRHSLEFFGLCQLCSKSNPQICQ